MRVFFKMSVLRKIVIQTAGEIAEFQLDSNEFPGLTPHRGTLNFQFGVLFYGPIFAFFSFLILAGS